MMTLMLQSALATTRTTHLHRLHAEEREAFLANGAVNMSSFIVVAPTYYTALDEVRCVLGLETCREAKRRGVHMLALDSSPAEVQAALREAGCDVRQQTVEGKKGVALREGIAAAAAEVPADGGAVCFQELEKLDMVGKWAEVVGALGGKANASIVVPRRADQEFKDSYPVEQYHQETFANLYLDALGKAAGMPSIDWTMGPLCFRASLADLWTGFDGALWDAQIVPMVRAARWHGAVVADHEVRFKGAETMRAQEESVPAYGDKRLDQLNFLWDKVGGALKEESEGAGVA